MSRSQPNAAAQRKLLISAEKAIKRLAKIAPHVEYSTLAQWLIDGDKLGECDASDEHFVMEWLEDAFTGGIEAYLHAKPYPKCVVCGFASHRFDKRSHTRYCSDKCRQKAYRMRNGSRSRTNS